MTESINKTKPKIVEMSLIQPFSLNIAKNIKTSATNTILEIILFKLNVSGKMIIVRKSSIAIMKECMIIRRGINSSLPYQGILR